METIYNTCAPSKYITSVDSGRIEKIIKNKSGWEINFKIRCFLLFKKQAGKTIPKVGDIVTLYTYQGSAIRGVAINDNVLYYLTDDQIDRERADWLKKYNKEKQNEFAKNKKRLDKDYANLPEIFRKRIDSFRNANPNFRVEYEAYEMFCCNEAVKIAEHCKTPERVQEFCQLEYKEQRKVMSDGHSGNTAGCARNLAYWYLEDPKQVLYLHGALTPLVGCVEYGCKHPRKLEE